VAQSHTLCNRCVRFVATVASGHATALPLDLGRTCTGWIAPLAHSLDYLVGCHLHNQGHRQAERTERGTITINAYHGQENGGDWITFAVTDTGIGWGDRNLRIRNVSSCAGFRSFGGKSRCTPPIRK
jgi:hypothetical protein